MSIDATIKPFKNQVWEQLRLKHDQKHLFEDSLFPASNSSLYHTQAPPRGIVWKRPKEAMSNPQFVVDGFNRCDLVQGYSGNCWFIAGCVGIMQSQKCFSIVVPLDQDFGDNYGGIFHFRFWLYGEWIDIVIDDRLPYWPDGKLLFCSNKKQTNELWGPLLEKAYAKLYGNYENLEGGFTTDAVRMHREILIDMSGGIQESFDIKTLSYSAKSKFWDILYQAYKKNSIIGCNINGDPAVREARLRNGLVKGHAFTVTKLAEINVNGKDVRLVRIRNPWGNDIEWNGAWSDNSREWNSVSADQKQELGIVYDHDGEFWMSFDDFMYNWEVVQICHLTLDGFSDELLETDDDSDLMWKCTTYHGEWKSGSTAGGCGQSNMAKFWTNPQYFVALHDVDKDDNEDKATVIVSLMQKDTRLKRAEKCGEAAEEYLQFRLYKIKDGVEVDENKTTHLRFYANQLERIGTSGSYINKREVTKRFRVDPGNYVIIASTYDEDINCDFMLRIYTEQLIETSGLDEKKENLTDHDIFFEVQDVDQVFSDWANFVPRSNEEDSEPKTNESDTPKSIHDRNLVENCTQQ